MFAPQPNPQRPKEVVSRRKQISGELVRFGISGSIGVVVGFLLYEGAFRILPPTEARPTLAWIVSYVVGITLQHALHRAIVFRDAISYWASLWRTYVVYAGGAVVAAGINYSVNLLSSLDHRLVWLLTTGFVALANFAALKLFAFAPPRESGR